MVEVGVAAALAQVHREIGRKSRAPVAQQGVHRCVAYWRAH